MTGTLPCPERDDPGSAASTDNDAADGLRRRIPLGDIIMDRMYKCGTPQTKKLSKNMPTPCVQERSFRRSSSWKARMAFW